MKPKREKFWEGIRGKTMGRESFWPQDGSKETSMWGWKGAKANPPPVPSCLSLAMIRDRKSRFLCHCSWNTELREVAAVTGIDLTLTGSDRKANHGPRAIPHWAGFPSEAWSTFLWILRLSCYSVLFLSLLALYFTFLIIFKIKHLFKVSRSLPYNWVSQKVCLFFSVRWL